MSGKDAYHIEEPFVPVKVNTDLILFLSTIYLQGLSSFKVAALALAMIRASENANRETLMVILNF